MVKCLPEFEYLCCVLENRNIISKIRRSKVTDYAALNISIRNTLESKYDQEMPQSPNTDQLTGKEQQQKHDFQKTIKEKQLALSSPA